MKQTSKTGSILILNEHQQMSMGANKNIRKNTPQKVVVVEGVQGSIKPHTILSF